MGYEKTTIKKMISNISQGKVYLPAIQRKFVWDVDQIERLFDSIMLKYPIGTFLFWKVNNEVVNHYVFYKFIQEYHERDSINERAPKPQCDSIIGILDGQQRLTSLYIALQGTYAYKKSRARWDNDDAFPKCQLYFNLLKNYLDTDTGITYEFKFLPINSVIENDESHHWFLVKNALPWENSSDYIPYAQENGLIGSKTALNNLQLLWQCVVNDDVINYYEVENQALDDILDIFIRVNSGGTQLSKSDLLFSTIVANWEDARENIDTLLKTINNKGEGFSFNNDFIMRLCLTLIDCQIKITVGNFQKENIEEIKANWGRIETALKRTIDILSEFGLSKERLTTNNIIIPLVYHLYKGGELNTTSKDSMKKYLIYGMLKQVFGSSGDTVLSVIRDSMRRKDTTGKFVLKNLTFSFIPFMELRFGGEYKFKFLVEDIDDLFEYEKGAYTFLVLSLLYPNIKFTQVNFHQDHLHPESSFNTNKKKPTEIDSDKWETCKKSKSKLANLQLLEERENESKSSTPLEDWFTKNVVCKGSDYIEKYKTQNYIPDVSLSLKDFEAFYSQRMQLMRDKLKEILL